MNTNKTETIVVYSQKLAGLLMYNGFQLLTTRKNWKFEDKLVFVFRKSDEICTAIDEYKKSMEDYTNGENNKQKIKLQI